MAGVKRRLFNTLAVLSLIVFGIAIAMLIWSQWMRIGVYKNMRGVAHVAEFRSGHFLVTQSDFSIRGPDDPNFIYEPTTIVDDISTSGANINSNFNVGGFRYMDFTSGQANIRRVGVPLWFVVLVTSVLPAFCLRRFRRELARRRVGKCEKCGYDLRATPQRCPECGAVPKVEISN